MPTVIVLDDLHWADSASLELLLNVAELVEEWPILIVCLLRPDKDAPSWSAMERAREGLGERYTEISLEPLDTTHAQELLGNLLYIEDLPESVRRLILNKAEGNPFFVEEVIRAPDRLLPHRPGEQSLASNTRDRKRHHPRYAVWRAECPHRPST